jgi:hypothetical protein
MMIIPASLDAAPGRVSLISGRQCCRLHIVPLWDRSGVTYVKQEEMGWIKESLEGSHAHLHFLLVANRSVKISQEKVKLGETILITSASWNYHLLRKVLQMLSFFWRNRCSFCYAITWPAQMRLPAAPSWGYVFDSSIAFRIQMKTRHHAVHSENFKAAAILFFSEGCNSGQATMSNALRRQPPCPSVYATACSNRTARSHAACRPASQTLLIDRLVYVCS